MSDPETLAYYNRSVADYVKMVARDKPDRDLQDFMDALPEGGKVLDLGCGPGHLAGLMAQAGFDVDATDKSAGMVAAAEAAGVNAWVAGFDDLTAVGVYDGILANFSLLHAARDAFPRHLTAIHRALKPKGRFQIGLKRGTGEKRDSLGRLYTYYELAELEAYLTEAGFTPLTHRFGETKSMTGDRDPFIIMAAHA